MDLNNPLSDLSLDKPAWPLRSINHHGLPAKVRGDLSGKTGCVENSIVGNGSVVSGGYVRDSVIGQNVYISSGAVVEESVIIGDVFVEERAMIRRAIIDHGNVIKAGDRIGFDLDYDADRYYVDPCGVVVVPHHGHALNVASSTRDDGLEGQSRHGRGLSSLWGKNRTKVSA
jgi:glucose-1-phosphate adenylyltransferase